MQRPEVCRLLHGAWRLTRMQLLGERLTHLAELFGDEAARVAVARFSGSVLRA